jgi:hypothetical protein
MHLLLLMCATAFWSVGFGVGVVWVSCGSPAWLGLANNQKTGGRGLLLLQVVLVLCLSPGKFWHLAAQRGWSSLFSKLLLRVPFLQDRLAFLEYAGKGCSRFELNKSPWALESEVKQLGGLIYW